MKRTAKVSDFIKHDKIINADMMSNMDTHICAKSEVPIKRLHVQGSSRIILDIIFISKHLDHKHLQELKGYLPCV